jgi:hypothetical protein
LRGSLAEIDSYLLHGSQYFRMNSQAWLCAR